MHEKSNKFMFYFEKTAKILHPIIFFYLFLPLWIENNIEIESIA